MYSATHESVTVARGQRQENSDRVKSRSKYAVLSDLHFTVYSDKLTFDVDGTCEFH